MKKSFFIFVFIQVIFLSKISAQDEANIWYFGHGAGLDFNSGTPVALTNGSLHTDEGCSTISDAAGNLLFYTDGDTVWNRNHLVMTNGTGLLGHNSTTQLQIVPKPGNTNVYYIFTADVGGGSNGLRYSEVDMTLSAGLGAVTATKNVLLHTPVTEKMVAVKSQNCADIWLISHDANTINFLAFAVTPTGVNPVPVVSPAGTLANAGICFGQLKASADGTKLAQALYWEGKVDVLNFNNATGAITLDFTIPTQYIIGTNYPYGIEFSPDGTRLYVTSSSYIDIYQYNLTLATPAAIIASGLIIGSCPPTDYLAGLQVGPDGKIYVAKWHGMGNGSGHGAISVINNPNALGLACAYSDNQINLLGKKCEMGFPNFISTQGGAMLITQNPTICTGSTYTLPDGTIVNASGTYIDTLNLINGCDSIITTNLTVSAVITTTQNPIICAGDSITLPGGSIVFVGGTYHDTINLSSSCDSVIVTNLTVTNAPITFQNTNICAGDSLALPGGGFVYAAGTYSDTLQAASGCDSIVSITLGLIPVFNTSVNSSICTGQTYTLPGGGTATISGTYYDTLTSGKGCDSIITTVLTVTSSLTGAQNPVLCSGNSFTLPDGTIVTTSGTYVDTVTSSGGCDSVITTTINIKPNSTASQSATICSNQNYTLPNGTIVNTSGTYNDTLIANNGCDSIITTTLTVNVIPTISISGTTTILTGQSTALSATGGGTYNWTPSTGLDNTTNNIVTASPTQTTIYCVEVTSANGCKDTSCITITVELPCPKAENLAVPNAFSPNGDNVNDEFCLQGWDDCVEEFNIVIYNRWGEKVYESNQSDFCWDGENQDPGVFVYYLKAKFSNLDLMINKKGNISLIK